jgi:hypothetical protein
MRMSDISPRTKKRIKGKLLADYGILPTPKKNSRKSMSSIPEDIYAQSTTSSSDDDDDLADMYS